MGRWMVNCTVQGDGYVLVDADTEDEAIRKATAEAVTITKAFDFDAMYAFPYEPEPETRAWAVTGRQAGEHVHVQVRHGQPGSRALLGTLVMREAEWETFRAAMAPLTGEA